MALADSVLELVNAVTGGEFALKYNKHYVGLARDGIADNFVTFRPRKDHLIVELRIPRSEDVTAVIDDSGIDSLPYDKRWGRYTPEPDRRRHRQASRPTGRPEWAARVARPRRWRSSGAFRGRRVHS